jgi:hypothetical protein
MGVLRVTIILLACWVAAGKLRKPAKPEDAEPA